MQVHVPKLGKTLINCTFII